MKKVNLIINIVLVVAIGILYFLHFKGDTSKSEPAKAKIATSAINTNDGPIAYIKIDSLLSNMKMYADVNEQLTSKQQKLETTFATQYQAFEKEVADFQNKVSKGLLTRREAQELEAQLGAKQSELENQRNNYSVELQEEGTVSQNKVINYLMEYLVEYNSDNKYSLIFSYSFGGGLLFADNSLDITTQVLEGINLKYEAEVASK